MSGPLAGVRVVEVGTYVFVPTAGAVLAEWGADVVKIEHPVTGDPYRGLVTTGLHSEYRGVDLNFQYANRSKRSVAIDLKTPDGRALLGRLLADADVFLTNLRGSAVAALGIDVDAVRADNPRIVYVRGTGYGPEGPDAERGGYDIAAFWARTGLLDLVHGDRPTFPPPSFGDLSAGLALAGAVAAALYRRSATGEPSVVDASLLGTGLWHGQPDVVEGAVFAPEDRLKPETDRSAVANPVRNFYRSRDGRWIALVLIEADRFWPDLCAVVGASELADDPRFADFEARRKHARECVEALDAVFATRDHAEWCEILQQAEGVWAPVRRADEVTTDPQVVANHHLHEVDLGDGHRLPLVTSPARFDGEAPRPERAPEHGQHTELVLLELGLTWDDLTDLKARGVIL